MKELVAARSCSKWNIQWAVKSIFREYQIFGTDQINRRE
jgi:hypothetical protein